MQQFVVPQFIDVEDKIIGPITTRQFVIMLVAGIIIFLFYRFGDFALFLIGLVVFGVSALIIAFVKINGQPFHYFILNMIQYLRKPDLRVWHKSYNKTELNMFRNMKYDIPEILNNKKRTSKKHIRDLSLLVNTGGVYKAENDL
jgi:hypothetical protein